MSYRTLLPGRSYRFLYPSINFACLPSKLAERQILVRSVRDTELQHLVEETLEAHPYVNRGRWLVTGMDLDKFEERSFYVESMVAVMEITAPLRSSILWNSSITSIVRHQNDIRFDLPQTTEIEQNNETSAY